MKTSEFKKKIEALGFDVETDSKQGVIKVYSDIDCEDYFLSVGSIFVGNLNVKADFLWGEEEYPNAIKLAVDYAFTPLAEREDEPKFYVRIAPSSNDSYSFWLMRKPWIDIDECEFDELNSQYEFTPTTYKQLSDEFHNPEWRPFLRDYDPDNTDVFVPVEDNE